MFGMGGTEILVILIVALLFLGPDKLPEAAKSISKGIRDLRKQTREFQETIEADEKIGGAIRDLKSALNGEEPRKVRPPRPLPAATPEAAATASVVALGEVVPVDTSGAGTDAEAAAVGASVSPASVPAFAPASGPSTGPAATEAAPAFSVGASSFTLPPTAGESSVADRGSDASAEEAKELASMIKPAEGAIAKGSTNGSTNGHG
jgi:sec-independent protein translocase protein TatB